MTIKQALAQEELTSSLKDAKRMCAQGMITLDGDIITSLDIEIEPGEHELRVGRKDAAIIIVD